MKAELDAHGIKYSSVTQSGGALALVVPEMNMADPEQAHIGYIYSPAGAYQWLQAFSLYARGEKKEP